MINSPIKRFKTYLKEELSSRQKKGFRYYADTYYGHDIPEKGPSYEGFKISSHIMPEGTDSMVIPAMTSLVQRVHDHLNTHGYTMDYGKQEAYKDGRTIKIGKVLSRTNAPKELMNKFAGDNHQESAEFSKNNSILISRDPNHIAECSTNKPWSSCAKLDSEGEPDDRGGPMHKLAAQLLPNEIMSGTHVAYLVANDPSKSHQELVDGAKARILLKPFHHRKTGNKILVPEGKTYSGAEQVPSGFRETLTNFTDKHFPIEPNTFYTKVPGLYNDDRVKVKANLDLDKPIATRESELPYHIRDTPEIFSQQRHITADNITKFIDDVKDNPNHPNTEYLGFAPHLPNFGDEHLAHFLQPDNWDELSYQTQHHLLQKKMNSTNHTALTSNLFRGLHNYKNLDNEINAYINNPGTKSEHIKQLLAHPSIQNPQQYQHNVTGIRDMLVQSPKLSGSDLLDVVKQHMNSSNPSLYDKVTQNPNFDKTHINELLKNNLPTPKNFIGQPIRNFTYISALGNGDKFSSDDISNVLDKVTSGSHDDHTKHSIFNSVLYNDNLNHHHLDKILTTMKPEHYNILKESIRHRSYRNVFNDIDKIHGVILKHFATKNNLDDLVSGIAYNLNEENLDTLFKSAPKISKLPTPNTIFYPISKNENITSSHLFKLVHPSIFNGVMSNTKNNILTHPEFTSEHLSDMIDNIGDYFDEDKSKIIAHPKFNTSDMGYSSQRNNEPNHFDFITESKNWSKLPEHLKTFVLKHPKVTRENINSMKSRINELSPHLQSILSSHPFYNK